MPTMPDSTALYLQSAHPEPNPLLLELEQVARKTDVLSLPREAGRLLSTLVHAMQANRILEIGTAFGYATLWMALAQPPVGKIWTFDPDQERTQIARSYFERSGESDSIEIFNQPALEILPVFPQRNMDLVFIDAPRRDYEAYLDLCIALLKLSGLVVLNGLLAGGKVADRPRKTDDPALTALRRFNKTFLSHPDLDATILPIGDGIGIGARIQ